MIKSQMFSAKRKTSQTGPSSSEIYSKTMQEQVIKNQNSIEDGATVVSSGYVAINDTPEESYESIFAEAANKFSSPISMAKPSTMESTGEMVEGKVDNKRKIMKGKILDRMGEEGGQEVVGPGHLCQDHREGAEQVQLLQHQFWDV